MDIFKDYGFKQGFQQIGESTKDFLGTLTGKAVVTTVALTAAYKAINHLNTEWTRAGEAAAEATSEFNTANSRLESLQTQKDGQKGQILEIAAKYDIDAQELQNANGELKNVDQMIATVNSHGGISLVDQDELNSISSANSQLEAQLAVQEQITEAKKQAMILATEKAASTEKTYYEQMKEDYGAFGGFFKWIQGQSHFEVDEYGNQVYKEESDADKFYGSEGDTTNLGLFKTKLSELKEYKSELKEIDAEIQKSKKNGEEIPQETIDRQNELVDSITNSSADLAGLTTTLSSQMEILSQGNSDFAISWVKDAKAAINDFNTIDLSPEEKHLSQIESFFDGSKVSSTLKDSIKQMLESGEIDSATAALHRMGVTLNDLGILGDGSEADFDNYFNGLISSAEEAEEAINGIDGSIDGVKAAFASENQDSDWNTMSGYLKQAQELYENGKIGTDDFKAAAQFISPEFINPDSAEYDASAYTAAWEAAYDKVQRYFDSENPSQSADNFVNDLLEQNLATQNDTGITWDFKTSAEAAKALKISVEAAEAAMHNLESYGAEFDDVMFSGEGLNNYENALEKIKAIRDSMHDKDSKSRLDRLIENWDSQLAGYHDDLSTLTEDQVLHIEFEYDMAQLQSEIDELQGLANEGDNTAKAALNYKKSEYREKREAENNYDESTNTAYAGSYKAVEALHEQLQNTDGEDARAAIQDQISGIYDLQNAFQDALADGEAVDWESYLGSDNAQKYIDDLLETMDMSKEALGDMLGVDSDLFSDQNNLPLSYEIDASEIECLAQPRQVP